MTVQDMNSVTVFTVMQIHHGKSPPAIILSPLLVQVNGRPAGFARQKKCGNGEICRICVGIGGKVRFFLKYCISDGIIPQKKIREEKGKPI